MSRIVFLLGAGASADAGMPLVADLTKQLRERLAFVHDINGKTRPEFTDLFDSITEYDPSVASNYEKFFEWLRFLRNAQTGTFRKSIIFRLPKRLVRVVPDLEWSIKRPIWEILRCAHLSSGYSPAYFVKMKDFLFRDRLDVFTTNFDLCVEDACRSDRISVFTGFRNGMWRPSTFRPRQQPGIYLYKLHGSLSWGLPDLPPPPRSGIVERYPPDWNREPELLLGPGLKLQYDDPYLTLYTEFRLILRRAKVCVVLGNSLRDVHIKQAVREEAERGMGVIDVNPSDMKWDFSQYTKICMSARDSLVAGHISTALHRYSA